MFFNDKTDFLIFSVFRDYTLDPGFRGLVSVILDSKTGLISFCNTVDTLQHAFGHLRPS